MFDNPNYHKEVGEGMKWALKHLPYYGRWYRFLIFWPACDGLLPALKIDPEVLIYRGGDNPWQPMYPEKLTRPKQKFNIESMKFGAELSFSKELKKAYPDDIIAVAKVAVAGGSSIIVGG